MRMSENPNKKYKYVFNHVLDQSKDRMNGWKWQAAVCQFYEELGWETEWEPQIWGLRGDIAARKMGAAAHKIYTQCKCWESSRIGPKTIWRLVATAYTFRAEPALAYYGDLNPKARKLAKIFRVRLIDEKALREQKLPSPEKVTGMDPEIKPRKFSEIFKGGMPPHELIAPDYKSRSHSPTEYPHPDFGEMWYYHTGNQADDYEPRPINTYERVRRIEREIKNGDTWLTSNNLAQEAGVNQEFTRSAVRLLEEFGVLERDGVQLVKS